MESVDAASLILFFCCCCCCCCGCCGCCCLCLKVVAVIRLAFLAFFSATFRTIYQWNSVGFVLFFSPPPLPPASLAPLITPERTNGGGGVPNESTDTMGSMRQRCVLRAVEGTKLAHYKQARRITGHETNALDNVMTFSWTG